MSTKELFKINKYLEVKLENGKTVIYLDSKPFMDCKYLLLINPQENLALNTIDSIDEAAEVLSLELESRELNPSMMGISPEQEFWGHCSNLQVWHEGNYSAKILHSNLAFPLLKALTDIGDIKAKIAFKNEIAERYLNGPSITKKFLIEEGYLNYLTREEFWSLQTEECVFLSLIEKELKINISIFNTEEDYLYYPDLDDQIGFSLYNNTVDRISFFKCQNITIKNWKKIFNFLSNFKSLEILSIEECNLRIIPESIKIIKSLKTLILNHNKIRIVPTEILEIGNLESILIEYNLINKMPNSNLIQKTKLKNVYLKGNKIDKYEVQRLRKLKKIKFRF